MDSLLNSTFKNPLRNKMKKNKFIIRIILLLLVSNSSTYFSQLPSTILSYESYLKYVRENNPIANRADNIKQYGELQYRAAKGNFDPFVSGNYENKLLNGTHYYSLVNSSVKIPLFTSQNLKLGYEYGTGVNINPEQFTSSFGLPYIGLEAGLLQGLIIDYRRADLMKSKEYVKYYNAETNNQINGVLYEASVKYFDWLFSLRQVSLNKYFLELAKQRLKGIEALAEIGEKPEMDTVEAAILYQTRLLDYQNAQIEKQKQNNDLAIFHSPKNTTNENIEFQTLDSLSTIFIKIKQSLIQNLYLDTINNPIISKYQSLQKVLEIDNRLKKEMIKPRLNVNYNLLSYNPYAFSPIYSSNNYKWGIDLSFPLFLRKARNEYKMSNINLTNNSLELQNKNNELIFKLNTLKQSLLLLTEQLENSERLVNFSKKLVEAEKLKFYNGESSLFLLNARENKWLDTELKFSEYQLKFIKIVTTIIYLKGTLNYQL